MSVTPRAEHRAFESPDSDDTLGILSLLFATMNQRGITSLPKIAFIAPWIVSAIYVLIAFGLCLFADDVTLHLGPVLATVGLGLGFGSGFAELRRTA